MKHIILLDSLDNLVIKKDSTLLFAHSMKARGIEVKLVFEEQLVFTNKSKPRLLVHDFSSDLVSGTYYLKKFELESEEEVSVEPGDCVHMRLDPPFNTRYLRIQWMLEAYKMHGVKILNDPKGVCLYNEKLVAYTRDLSLNSYVGSSEKSALAFCLQQKNNDDVQEVILKPLDLFQGIGVVRCENDPKLLREAIKSLKKDHGVPFIVQPFAKEVVEGELRSIFFKGHELGTILKVPPEGDFLANIARGATFSCVSLEKSLMTECKSISRLMANEGVDWIAFDLLAGKISEVNITCPGLLVEVSQARNENLADKIIDLF